MGSVPAHANIHLPVRSSRHQANGFTLVELLVSIGIIGILVSLLLPALGVARRHAQRTRCLANLRSIAQACHEYASQNQGFLPPSVYFSGAGVTYSFSFDLKDSVTPTNGPMGLGLLIEGGYIAPGAANVFHDPMMDTTYFAIAPGHGMDVPPRTPPGFVEFCGASYFNDTTGARVITSYTYRATSYAMDHHFKPMRIDSKDTLPDGSVNTSPMVLISDMLDSRFGRKYTHQDGYNLVHLDTSGEFYSDHDGQIDGLQSASSGQFDGYETYTNDELIYTRYLEAR